MVGVQGESVLTKTETRQSKRTPVTLKIKFKSATLDQFIERYAIDVSQGGIFIRTKDPLPVGTTMRFEFQLRDASPLIMGEGTVVWIREHSPNQAGVAPGMGVRFDRITESSQTVLDQILSQKALRGTDDADQSFTETPTRVAPAPLVDDLAKETKNRTKQFASVRAEPASKPQGGGSAPVPFRSDADEFSEEAFEQATKVHSLDDLAAASMRLDAAADEPLELGTAGGVEEEEEDLPIQGGDAVVLGAAGARDNAGAAEGPAEADDSVTLGAAGAIAAAGRASADDAPSQTDDRAQTTIFPSKHRIRPMVSLPPPASVAGAGSASGGASGGGQGSPADRDSEQTNPRVALAVDSEALEPTVMREPGMPSPKMVAVEAKAESRASTADEPTGTSMRELGATPDIAIEMDDAEDGVGDDGDTDEPASTAAGSARSRAADVAADDRAGSALAGDGEGEPAASPAHAAAVSQESDGDDEEGLTALLSRPAEPRPRSRMPVFLAVAAVLIVLGGGGAYLFTRSSEQPVPRTEVPDPAATTDQTDEPGTGPQAAAQPGTEPEAEPEAEIEIEAAPRDEPGIEPEIEIEPEPPVETVEVVVRSSPEGATATLVDTTQEGPTPMTFEVDASKTHTVRISHPGYVAQEISIDPKASEAPRVALEPTPWVMRFTSTPEGAVVYLDGRRVAGLTPNELTLPPGWEKKKHYKVSFRLAHHEKLDIIVDNQFEADSAAMVQRVEGTMVQETEAPAHSAPRHAPASDNPGGAGKQAPPGGAGSGSGDSTQEAAAPAAEAEPSKSEAPPASPPDENAAPAPGDQAPAP